MCSVYPSFYRPLHLTPACQSTSGLQPTDEARFCVIGFVRMFLHILSTVGVFFAVWQAAPSWTLFLPSCSPRMCPTHTHTNLWKRSSWYDMAELCLKTSQPEPQWSNISALMLFLERRGCFAALLDNRPSSRSLVLTVCADRLTPACCPPPQHVPLWWRSDPTAESPEGDSRGACSCAT